LWARIGAFLLLVLLLAAAYRLSTAYLRAQQRALERRVEERTAELRKKTEELQESRRQLELIAHSDPLTGLPNRRMFTGYFRRLLASAQRHEDSSFTLMLVDLDKFKEINDAWGHDAGDAWLKSVAERVGAVMRQSDCFARVGGDEFALLVSDPSDEDGIAVLCRRLAGSVRDPLPVKDAALATTLSIGIASYPQDGADEASLFKAADIALYRVKHAGGNGWLRYSDLRETEASFGEPVSR
jgi:diguanylate cyclase (GGDEF)-like protein